MTEPDDAQVSGEQVELIDALIRASFLTMAVLTKQAAAHDISLTQLRVMGILRDRRLTMSALADHLGLDRSTVSGLVDRLEGRGLIERRPNPADRRSFEVRLTKAGKAAAERGADQVTSALAPLVSGLSRTETRRLTELVERVLEEGPQLPA